MGEVLEDKFPKAKILMSHTKKLEADLEKLGWKIRHHESSLKFLKAHLAEIDDFILKTQDSTDILKNHQLGSKTDEVQSETQEYTEDQIIKHLLQHNKRAAGIICMLKAHQGAEASDSPPIKDMLGIVATLGKVKDDNLSRVLSEYLGHETMLAIVCKTYEGVKVLEMYDRNGMVNKNDGLHRLGSSIDKPQDGRFHVICLEDLGSYTGDFIPQDPQKRLAILKPRLPSGDIPQGFLGYAVNMIDVEDTHLFHIAPDGSGLRESLFYSLFSRLQVYRTRADMQLALPYICYGAISLDGGIIRRNNGMFSLGNRRKMDVRFATNFGSSNVPLHIIEALTQMRHLKWKKERLSDDIQRQVELLNTHKDLFKIRRKEFVKNVRETTHSVHRIVSKPKFTVYVRRHSKTSDCDSSSSGEMEESPSLEESDGTAT